jgi:FixJ family two-component response regulator
MTPRGAPTVFVIDDDVEVRMSIQGLQCESFETAEEFLREQESDGPGCLVLDVSLPGVSGLELSGNWQNPECAFPSSS